MKYVYGPIPSRRLGQSLGIDPIPLKTCNWNCVYCQLGRTTPLTNERRDYVSPAAILDEVRVALAAHAASTIDWVSFVGSGEPTLHASLGAMIRQVKAMTAIPVAVITNGALLYRPEVRAELLPADAVMPTLPAGTAALYRKIVRPWPELSFERLLDGLIAFRREYAGKLWIEVMLIGGLNDTFTALQDLALAVRRIAPDAIHLTLPERPPAEPWVRPPDDEALLRATAILGATARVVSPAHGHLDMAGYDNVLDAVVDVITRHPIREADLVDELERWAPGQVQAALDDLAASGRAQVVTRYGQHFWSGIGSHYATASTRQPSSPTADVVAGK
jgi:wyosine [tRNA(Phe)-imidazoG37] synthetase (radical SAM superfamily)